MSVAISLPMKSLSEFSNELKHKMWLENIAKYLSKYDLLDVLNSPDRVYSVGEYQVLLERSKANTIGAENMTLLLGGSAAGVQTPPSVVLKTNAATIKRMRKIPNSWSIGIKMVSCHFVY